MRILHVLSQRPEMTGSGVFITHMMQQAAADGHENALLAGVPNDFSHDHPAVAHCCHVEFIRFGDSPAKSDNAPPDLPHHVTGMSDVMPYPSTRFSELTAEQLTCYETCFAERLVQAVTTFAPDIIHCNHLWLITSLAGKLFPQIPVVATCHGSDLRQFRINPHLRERVLEGCRKLTAVFALTEMQRGEIAAEYGIEAERIHVTGAGYDATLFTPSDKPASPPVRIVYAGKLSNAKGVPWLLDAIEILVRERHFNVTLALCGSASGPEAEAIAKKAATMTLHDMPDIPTKPAVPTQLTGLAGLTRSTGSTDSRGSRGATLQSLPTLQTEPDMHSTPLRPRTIVELRGNLSHAQLAETLKQSHIFVLPSFHEGLPLVLLEALACNCRLVATELPGVTEVFSSLPAENIQTVPLPQMLHHEQPTPEEGALFSQRIADAIQTLITRHHCDENGSRNIPSPELPHHQSKERFHAPAPLSPACKELLHQFSWQAVYGRIARIYHQVSSAR